ncbi:Rieske 2Fe-2S domain-containing protein [Paeniglutamicibacter psychrophenolicus]|uniref:Rieske 2Fe-2S domain-containing protein n=1 Tax=Paeniglutamicibacter psychrophenolicus TaxID=257454 RepID=UPI00277F91A5|nr:Rieske 2Fe-2S domain-containing protein [Paeniglutamicibacter psychrophenolicus]MDQ0093735.1 3-phenylpropionate/trans-cinnamate dioxygenase ferredoxin subunit [Paeniglutamicibacter psychrophenolicus]
MHGACPLTQLARGYALRLDTSPPITVLHTEEGELFEIDDTCTHQDAPLADGRVENREAECPLHASKSSLRTGEVDQPPAKRPVRVREVTVVDGIIMVAESDAAPNLPPGISLVG